MYYVEEDSNNGNYNGSDGEGNSVSFTPDSGGEYTRKTDGGGYDVFENSNGETVAHVRTYD